MIEKAVAYKAFRIDTFICNLIVLRPFIFAAETWADIPAGGVEESFFEIGTAGSGGTSPCRATAFPLFSPDTQIRPLALLCVTFDR